MKRPPISEELFHQFCRANEIGCQRIPTSTTETPDYLLDCDGHSLVAEVKQFDENDDSRRLRQELNERGSVAWFPPAGQRLRKKLRRANSQLGEIAKPGIPGLLILFSNDLFADFDSLDIRAAMYGEDTISVAINHETNETAVTDQRLGRNGQARNRTAVSALCYLHSSSRLNVYHNRFADTPLNPTYFWRESIRHFVLAEKIEGQVEGWRPVPGQRCLDLTKLLGE